VQGLTPPWVISKVNPEDKYGTIPEQRQEIILQKKIAQASRQFLSENHRQAREQNKYLENLFARLAIDLENLFALGD
jgi:monovalent cation/hydrogen antiporter